MSSQELQTRYSYRFALPARKAGEMGSDEPSKAEIQAYINQVLGVHPADSKQKPD